MEPSHERTFPAGAALDPFDPRQHALPPRPPHRAAPPTPPVPHEPRHHHGASYDSPLVPPGDAAHGPPSSMIPAQPRPVYGGSLRRAEIQRSAGGPPTPAWSDRSHGWGWDWDRATDGRHDGLLAAPRPAGSDPAWSRPARDPRRPAPEGAWPPAAGWHGTAWAGPPRREAAASDAGPGGLVRNSPWLKPDAPPEPWPSQSAPTVPRQGAAARRARSGSLASFPYGPLAGPSAAPGRRHRSGPAPVPRGPHDDLPASRYEYGQGHPMLCRTPQRPPFRDGGRQAVALCTTREDPTTAGLHHGAAKPPSAPLSTTGQQDGQHVQHEGPHFQHEWQRVQQRHLDSTRPLAEAHGPMQHGPVTWAEARDVSSSSMPPALAAGVGTYDDHGVHWSSLSSLSPHDGCGETQMAPYRHDQRSRPSGAGIHDDPPRQRLPPSMNPAYVFHSDDCRGMPPSQSRDAPALHGLGAHRSEDAAHIYDGMAYDLDDSPPIAVHDHAPRHDLELKEAWAQRRHERYPYDQDAATPDVAHIQMQVHSRSASPDWTWPSRTGTQYAHPMIPLMEGTPFSTSGEHHSAGAIDVRLPSGRMVHPMHPYGDEPEGPYHGMAPRSSCPRGGSGVSVPACPQYSDSTLHATHSDTSRLSVAVEAPTAPHDTAIMPPTARRPASREGYHEYSLAAHRLPPGFADDPPGPALDASAKHDHSEPAHASARQETRGIPPHGSGGPPPPSATAGPAVAPEPPSPLGFSVPDCVRVEPLVACPGFRGRGPPWEVPDPTPVASTAMRSDARRSETPLRGDEARLEPERPAPATRHGSQIPNAPAPRFPSRFEAADADRPGGSVRSDSTQLASQASPPAAPPAVPTARDPSGAACSRRLPRRMHACPWCPMQCARRHDLRRHMATHTQAQRFLCVHCGKGFTRRDVLHRHLRLQRCPSMGAAGAGVEADAEADGEPAMEGAMPDLLL